MFGFKVVKCSLETEVETCSNALNCLLPLLCKEICDVMDVYGTNVHKHRYFRTLRASQIQFAAWSGRSSTMIWMTSAFVKATLLQQTAGNTVDQHMD